MAVKKPYLDEKIINVARKEFLKYGYRNASLHKIAEKAGTTTGALYTRYKSKDDLFVSLVKNVASIIKDHSKMVMCENLGIQEPHDIQTISGVIKKEMAFYNKLLSEHFEECYLFYCKSEGSSIDALIKELLDRKAKTTVTYFKSIAKRSYNYEGIEFLMDVQFGLLKSVLEHNYQNKTPMETLDIIDIYQAAGWKAVFEAVSREP